jgi:hypothetical protein
MRTSFYVERTTEKENKHVLDTVILSRLQKHMVSETASVSDSRQKYKYPHQGQLNGTKHHMFGYYKSIHITILRARSHVLPT